MKYLDSERIFSKIKTILQGIVSGATIGRETRLRRDCEFDELDWIEFIMSMEEELKIDIEDAIADKIFKNDLPLSSIVELAMDAERAPDESPEWKQKKLAEMRSRQRKTQKSMVDYYS